MKLETVRADDLLNVVAQGFYGNRTSTTVKRKNIDRFLLGVMDEDGKIFGTPDITIAHFPVDEKTVYVYNKYRQEDYVKRNKKYEAKGITPKPLISIPEDGVNIYCPCIICEIDDEGNLQSLPKDGLLKVLKYLAE